MHKVVDKDLRQVCVEQAASDLLAADARSLDRLKIGDLDTGHVLHDQHAAGRCLGIDTRYPDMGVVGKVQAETLGVFRLGHKVEFAAGSTAEFVVEAIQVDATADGPVAIQPAGRGANGTQIRLDDLVNARSLDLDHDLVAREQARAMDLGQRGGSLRFGRKPGKDLVNRLSEFSLDYSLDVGQTLGQDLILQPG